MAMTEPEQAARMVQLAVAGDEYAFARIVAAYHDDLSRVAFVVCREADMAQEAVQEAWSICWRQLPRLRDPARLRGWLVATAANQARQVVRRSVRELELGDRHGAVGVDPAGGAGDMDLRNALGRLSAEDRSLLALRYVAGVEATALSRLTGLSPSGTRARPAAC